MNLNINLSSINVNATPPTGSADVLRRDLLSRIGSTDEFLLILDNTSAEKFTTCPTSALFYLLYKRERQAKNAALVFGGAVHAGLEVLYKGPVDKSRHAYYTNQGVVYEDGNALPESSDEFIARQDAAVVSYFISHPSPIDEYRTVSNAIELLQHYRIYASVVDLDFRHLDPLFVENAFELPLGVIPVNANIQLPTWPEPTFVSNVHVAWSGKMDLAGYFGNKLYLIDHKTTSIGGDSFIQDFRLANQTRGYCWAFHELFPNLPVPAFMGNAIFFKRPTGNGSLVDKGPRGGQAPLQFFRFQFDYSEVSIATWKKNILYVVSDLVHCMSRNFFPQHTKACFGKYGVCPYWDVCTVEDENMAARMLQTDLYKDVTWDPTK